MSELPVFYVFVNLDLDLSKGQVAAQVSHITHQIVEDLVKKCYEVHPPSKECLMYMKWKINPVTVILKATTNQLNELLRKDGSKCFIDSGNRIPDNALTVVGFSPTNQMSEFVKDYKLL